MVRYGDSGSFSLIEGVDMGRVMLALQEVHADGNTIYQGDERHWHHLFVNPMSMGYNLLVIIYLFFKVVKKGRCIMPRIEVLANARVVWMVWTVGSPRGASDRAEAFVLELRKIRHIAAFSEFAL